MTPMTVRGLPARLQRDAWWMAADTQSGIGRGAATPSIGPIWILILLVVASDLMLLRTDPGLGFVAAVLSLAAAAHWTLRAKITPKRAAHAWGMLSIAVIPAIDQFQFISWAIAIAGLSVFAAMITGPRVILATLRLPFDGIAQSYDDLRHIKIDGTNRTSLKDWMLPIGVGIVFATLFALANPIIGKWVSQLNFDSLPSIWRVIAWGVMAAFIWPLLRLSKMRLHRAAPTSRVKLRRVGLINVRSVTRALVVFNLLFAAQTTMDMGYLWGGVRLPDGMTYAGYAHQGAYPLMVTALLAGGFALIAQPWLDGRITRGLLLLWIAQTLVLVMSSILRLDLYVDVYGMTHMRFAAFVWMAVVAIGLVILILQILGRKSTGWMLRHAFGVGFVAVYLCSLTNVAGYVARHQFSQGPLDVSYVCGLAPGAAPVIAQNRPDLCWNQYDDPTLMMPSDWREWGFRNARLRHKLATITAETGA